MPTLTDPDAAELRAQREAAAASPANAQLCEIVRLLELASDLASEWAAEHGPDCDCPFCRHTRDFDEDGGDPGDSMTILADDVAGIRWQTAASASLIGGMTFAFTPAPN